MKKTIILAGLMAAAAVTTTYAKGAKSIIASSITAIQDDGKQKIDPATLPDAVKKTLADDSYKGWTISNAWAVKGDPMYYTVELKKDDKTNTVNITADGKVK